MAPCYKNNNLYVSAQLNQIKQILYGIYKDKSDRECWNSVSIHVNEQKR